MTLKDETLEIDTQLRSHLQKITGKQDKALEDIIFNVSGCISRTNISVKEYIADFQSDKIFNPDCLLLDNVEMFKYFNKKYIELAAHLFARRSTGLGTPTAACGEGELMAIVCSPRVKISKKKNEGDLKVDNKTIELKGDGVRVFSTKSGNSFYKEMMALSKLYNFIPNEVNKGRTAFEPWKDGKTGEMWSAQFKQSGPKIAKEFLIKLMNATGSEFSAASIDNCFKNGIFSSHQLRCEIIKSFFRNTTKEWDAFTCIKDGIIRSVSPDATSFDALVDAGVIIPGSNEKDTVGNYFRIFNNNDLGWYFRFV
jgi:hypothetical protein